MSVAPRRIRQATPTDVFVNVPFDRQYERLYLALIAGLTGLGLTPRSALEVAEVEARLERIFGLMKSCRYSLHDLSRVQLDRKAPRCPRFNMPFELGLAVALKLMGTDHRWRVFEEQAFRAQKSLSDINGFDPMIHNGSVAGMLNALADTFVKENRPGIRDLMRAYRHLAKFAKKWTRETGSRGLYGARIFTELVVAGTKHREEQDRRAAGRSRRTARS